MKQLAASTALWQDGWVEGWVVGWVAGMGIPSLSHQSADWWEYLTDVLKEMNVWDCILM